MKITYNQILETFEGFATAHKQINEFDSGDLWEVCQHDKLSDYFYPLMFVTDTPASVGDGEITISFEVLVMDRADEEIENEVKSDTLLILLDTVAYFEKLYTDNWKFATIQKSATATPFTERFDDTVTGWSMGISIKMPLQYDECSIPYTGYTPGATSCLPVTIIDGLSTVEVASGGGYTCTAVSADIELRFNFDLGDGITATQTITSFEAGVYTSIADDGSSGTITVSINGGAFVAFSTLNPLTLVDTDTIAFTRTTTTAAGYTQITGTY